MREWVQQPWSSVGLDGDASRHRSRSELQDLWRSLPRPPADTGEVLAVVVRRPDGSRGQPDRCRLDPMDGVAGDRWATGKRDLGMQVSIMRADVAHLIANGQSGVLFGNNLLVDLDLSAENLSPGTMMRIGATRCVVSDEPHNGCSLFAQRFGHAALALTADKRWRDQNLRGLYLTVIEAGEVGPGDPIAVVQRP